MTEAVASSPSPQQSAQPAPQSSPQAPSGPPASSPAPASNGGTLLSGAAPAPQPASSEPAQLDWRARFAGDDPKALETLSRYKTEADFGKAFLEQRAKLSQRPEIARLPDNATPEQVSEYRKAMGVPNEGTLEAYGIKAPDGYKMAEPEQAALSEFAKLMHSKNAPAGLVKEATDYFFRTQQATEQGLAKLDIDRQREWQGQLEKQLGRDFQPMVAAGEAFLNSHFSDNPEGKSELLNARLPGGGRIGDHPGFISLIADLALKNGFTDRIEANALESGGKSLEQQQAEIEALRMTDSRLYNEPATQAKLDKIIGLRLSKGEIDESGNPVRRRRTA